MLIKISIYNTIDLSFRIIKNEHMHALYLIYMVVKLFNEVSISVHVYPALGYWNWRLTSVFKDLSGP